MPPKQVVFIHHNQSGGKLSQDDTIRVWAHVSRRSWQEKPRHLTVRVRDPQENVSEEDDQACLSSDREMVTVPPSRFWQAYASKTCLQPFRPPEDLALLEMTYVAVSENIIKVHVSWPTPVEGHSELQLLRLLENSNFAVQCGVDCLYDRNTSQAFALFEYASRVYKIFLSQMNIKLSYLALSAVLESLTYAQSRGLHDVVRLFLTQIGSLAAVAYGRMHPLSVCTRSLLTLGVSPTLTSELAVAQYQIAAPKLQLSREMVELCIWDAKSCSLRGNYPLDEAEQTYSRILSLDQYKSDRYHLQFNKVRMAIIYLGKQMYTKALAVLHDAPDELQEYIDNGWIHTSPSTAPLSMIGIVMRLIDLGRARAGLGEHDLADEAFRLSVFAGQKYFKYDDPMLITAQKAYARYLLSQNRRAEAEEIERAVERELAAFMLIPSSI